MNEMPRIYILTFADDLIFVQQKEEKQELKEGRIPHYSVHSYSGY